MPPCACQQMHLLFVGRPIRDYWSLEENNAHINVKELWAVYNAIQSLPQYICNMRLDVCLDSLVALHTWHCH